MHMSKVVWVLLQWDVQIVICKCTKQLVLKFR